MPVTRRQLTNALILVYLAIQLALPWRGLLQDKLETRGDFSWNMYSQRYRCEGRYIHLLPDGRGVRIDPRRNVRRRRFSSVCHIDRLPSFHAWLCQQAERQAPGSRIRAGVEVSHNLGPYVRLVSASTEICESSTYGVER